MSKLLIFLALACAAYSLESCVYTSGESTYDLSSISKFTYSPSADEKWKIDLCKDDDDDDSTVVLYKKRSHSKPNSEDSLATIGSRGVENDDHKDDDKQEHKDKWVPFIVGSSNVTVWAEIEYEQSSYTGVEVLVGSTTSCPLGENYKIAIEFVCVPDQSEPLYSSVVDGCLTYLYVNSSSACPISIADFGSAEEVPTVSVVMYVNFLITILTPILLMVCCCCAVCARRRQMKRRAISRNLSNIAFQPIPSSQTFITPTFASFQTPIYNPFIQQQQCYIYVNDQDALASAQPFTVESDELLARQLQSRFDSEL